MPRRPCSERAGEHRRRAARPSAPRRRPHRTEAEVDRLVEPALVAHRGEHRHSGRPLADSAAPTAGAAQHQPAARSRSANRWHDPRGRRHARHGRRRPRRSTRSQRAASLVDDRVGRPGQVDARRCRDRDARPTAPRASANACSGPGGRRGQVRTPSAPRRGSASRSDRALSRPVVWHSASQRMPSGRSRPSTRSTPGPSGSRRRRTASPRRRGHLAERARERRRTRSARPPITPITSPGRGCGVAEVGEQLDHPGLGARAARRRSRRRRRGRRGTARRRPAPDATHVHAGTPRRAERGDLGGAGRHRRAPAARRPSDAAR